MRAVPRLARLGLIALAVVAFVAVSVVLARFLATEGRERSAVVALLRAQARGDAAGIVARIDGCRADPACRAAARANAARLRRPGKLEVVRYDSGTRYALRSEVGDVRVVWRVAGRLPVVQCVRVRREVGVLSGTSVTLRSLSAPIGGEASC